MDYKKKILKIAYESFKDAKAKNEAKDKAIKNSETVIDCNYRKFCSDNTYWLQDFALFSAIRELILEVAYGVSGPTT